MQHAYILSNNNNYSWGWKVKKGHKRSNHGHEKSYGQEQKRKIVTYYILGCSAFFWYTSCICSKLLSFEVIRGQWRSAWGQSFDLSLVWTYFHCNTAVFSFQLICNMPIFLAIIILTILEVERSKKVIIYIIHMFEIGKFWGHWRSAWGQSFDLTCLDTFSL